MEKTLQRRLYIAQALLPGLALSFTAPFPAALAGAG